MKYSRVGRGKKQEVVIISKHLPVFTIRIILFLRGRFSKYKAKLQDYSLIQRGRKQ